MCVNTWRCHKTETFQLLQVNQVNVLIVLNAERRILLLFFLCIILLLRSLCSPMALRLCHTIVSHRFYAIPVVKFFYPDMDLDLIQPKPMDETHIIIKWPIVWIIIPTWFEFVSTQEQQQKKALFGTFQQFSFCNDTQNVRCSMFNRSIYNIVLIELRDIFVLISSTFSHAFDQRNTKPILDRWLWIFRK